MCLCCSLVSPVCVGVNVVCAGRSLNWTCVRLFGCFCVLCVCLCYPFSGSSGVNPCVLQPGAPQHDITLSHCTAHTNMTQHTATRCALLTSTLHITRDTIRRPSGAWNLKRNLPLNPANCKCYPPPLPLPLR